MDRALTSSYDGPLDPQPRGGGWGEGTGGVLPPTQLTVGPHQAVLGTGDPAETKTIKAIPI